MGESAREMVSQSSIVMLPSARSAMIWMVQPASPDMRTRTKRYPKPVNTGSAIAARRAAAPCSTIKRGSDMSSRSRVSVMR